MTPRRPPSRSGVRTKEVVALDPENKAGLKVKYEFPMELTDAEDLIKSGKLSEARAVMDKALALQGISADMRQEGLMTKGEILETEGKFADVIATLKAAKEAAPKSPAVGQINERIAHFDKLAAAEEPIRKLEAESPNTAGLDRAKLLDKIIVAREKLPENEAAAKSIEKWSKEIIALDADNKAGLKKKYEFRVAVGEAVELADANKFGEADAALDKALAIRASPVRKCKRCSSSRPRSPAQAARSPGNKLPQEGPCRRSGKRNRAQIKQMVQQAEKGEKGPE